jgi:hypothetical protein
MVTWFRFLLKCANGVGQRIALLASTVLYYCTTDAAMGKIKEYDLVIHEPRRDHATAAIPPRQQASQIADSIDSCHDPQCMKVLQLRGVIPTAAGEYVQSKEPSRFWSSPIALKAEGTADATSSPLARQ